MKKNRSLLVWLLIAAMLLTGCGAKEEAVKAEAAMEAPAEMFVTEEAGAEEAKAEYETGDFATTSQNSASGMAVEEVKQFAEKIIYTGDIFMETTDFDGAIASLDEAVTRFGGFVEDSNVSGSASYNADGSTVVKNRWAYYKVRIPTDKFDGFMAVTDGIGNVTSAGRSAQNVTSQYTDYEARLSSLYTQEERLLDMLEKTSDLDSLITLEQRLSEVRYEIESIERNLRNLDQRLAYSTVTLEIREVEIYTPTVTVQRTFGEKLGDAFADGWKGFTRGLQRFILWFAESLPSLVIWAVILGGGAAVFFRIRKKRAARKAAKEEKKD